MSAGQGGAPRLGRVEWQLLDAIEAAGGKGARVVPPGATPSQAASRRRAAGQLVRKGLAGTWTQGQGRHRASWIGTPADADRHRQAAARAALDQARAALDQAQAALDRIEGRARRTPARPTSQDAADGDDDGQGALW